MTSLITKIRFKGRKLIASLTLLTFLFSGLTFPSLPLYAQDSLVLPNPGSMIAITSAYVPPMLKGMKVNVAEPFTFDFIMDSGNDHLGQEALKQEARKLIKYFLASLTIPEKDLWVNLSPYEKEKIVPNEFGITEMGRDLLAEDYILKQLTASLICPERDLGKEFWNRVYAKATKLYGNREIPVNTFNKVWILPDKAVVYQNRDTVYVLKSHLKVMLEEDYLALEKHSARGHEQGSNRAHTIGSQVIREIVLPELEKEVNTGKHFARLRQIYSSLILAKWYKQTLKASILNRAYSDQKKTAGVDVDDKTIKEKIYQQYLKAFKKGVFNYIKEDYDAGTQTVIPRKYFSGGLQLMVPLDVETSPAMASGAVPVGKLNWIKGIYRQSQGAGPDADMRASKNGVTNVIWFAGVDQSNLLAAREGIFGKNLENWLEMHNRNGDTTAREEATRDLLNDGEFINRIKSIPKDDVALEIIRFAVRKNLYLGTKSFQLFLDALKQHAGLDIKKQLPNFSIPIKSFVQVIAGVALIHDYLDNGEFQALGREDKLAALVGEIRRLNLPLESDNLGHIYTALPGQISARVKKKDLQKVDLPMSVFDQVRAALGNKDVKRYLDRNVQPAARKRIWAGDLLRLINRSGYSLRINPLAFYSGLPLNIRSFVVPVEKNYHTNGEGRLVVKIYRSSYRVYNFTDIPMGNDFWLNRTVTPLWNHSGEIVAFETENGNGQPLTINAMDVIEQGIPTMQVVKQYRQKEVYQEVVANTRRPEDVIEIEAWSHRLEEVIRAYNGTTTEAAVTGYFDFLVTLFELKQVKGSSADEILQMAAEGDLANVDEARGFLRYLTSSTVVAKGVDIRPILSKKIVNSLGGRTMAGGAENENVAPGGIDFNPNSLELETQGQAATFSIPNMDGNSQYIHIDNGLLPIITNVTAIVDLRAVLSPARKAEPQLAGVH